MMIGTNQLQFFDFINVDKGLKITFDFEKSIFFNSDFLFIK